MAHAVCPSGVPRIGLRQLQRLGYRTVGNIKSLADWYKNSWYGKRFPAQPTAKLDYCHWWMSWVNAAYCEILINKKHKLK